MNINEVINKQEYAFLRDNEHLGNKIMFVVFGGSLSYGTNVKASDIDIRGIAVNSPDELLGIKEWKQYTDNGTDTVIYSFNKIIELLMNANPNVIEMLGCKPEHYALISPIGQLLLDNKEIFLSKKAIHSFAGYANSQLRRLQNAIARDSSTQSVKETHIKKSIEIAMNSFEGRYSSFDENAIKLSTMETNNPDYEKEIVIDILLKKYPMRELSGMLNEMNNIISVYDRLNHRNNKKDEIHLNKHAMHLIRLYMMCLDILENGEINTFREKEHDTLMAIRNGYFANNDGTYKKEFFDIVDEYERKVMLSASKTKLPDTPDFNKINELVKKVNRIAIDIK